MELKLMRFQNHLHRTFSLLTVVCNTRPQHKLFNHQYELKKVSINKIVIIPAMVWSNIMLATI